MPWFKVDDKFAGHPKTVAAGNTAIGLWVRAGSWCAQHLTDGAVPPHMLAALGGRPKDADALVSAGLWAADPAGGWRFHDWETYQPTRAQVDDVRAKRAEAGRIGGKASGKSRQGLKVVDG